MADTPGELLAVADEGFAGDGRGAVRMRSVAAIDTVPRTISVGHYDPARDYQAGVQRVRRPGAGSRDDRVDVAAAIDAGTAKTVAAGMLARAQSERVRRRVALAFDGMAIPPGRCLTIAGEAGTWRVVDSAIAGMVTTLALVPIAMGPIALTGSSGRAVSAADDAVGATMLAAFETPGLDDVPLSAPRLSIAANGAGRGWRQAALLYSVDEGTSWVPAGATAVPAVMGIIAVVASPAPATLIDRAGAFEVTLGRADMVLGDADADALDRGANLALAGDELVQFGRAEPLGGARWRLSQLLRGRRGTESAIGTQAVGTRFVVLDVESVRTIDLPLAAIGRDVRVLASGVADGVPVEARVVMAGASVVPLTPVPAGVSIAADGSAVVRWIRRSRAGWRWIDGVDVPLGEESEAYRVTIAGAFGMRSVETAEPVAVVTAGERTAGPVTVAVRQRGTFGESPAIIIAVAGTGGTS